MEFRRRQDMPHDPHALWCRQSRLAGIVRCLIWCGVLTIPLAIGWHVDLRWLVWLGAGLAAIVGPLMLFHLLKLFRRSNWVLRIGRDGLWINLLPLHDGAPDAAGALHLAYREIAAVHKHTEAYSTPSEVTGPTKHGGDTLRKDQHLEIRLRNEQTDAIREALKELRNPERTGKVSVARREPFPVWLVSHSVLRIVWYSSHGRVMSHRIARALARLKTSMSVGEPTRRDRPVWRELSAEEAIELARELVQVHGNGVDSTALLVKVCGMSTVEASGLVNRFYADPAPDLNPALPRSTR
jgi:hypothetical protein